MASGRHSLRGGTQANADADHGTLDRSFNRPPSFRETDRISRTSPCPAPATALRRTPTLTKHFHPLASYACSLTSSVFDNPDPTAPLAPRKPL